MRTSIIPLALVTALTVTACSSQEHPASNPTSPSAAQASSASSVGLQGKPGGGSDISVTTTVNAVDASGLASDIAGDGQGAYLSGVSGVISILTANGYNGIVNGDWQFDTTASPARRVRRRASPTGSFRPARPSSSPWRPRTATRRSTPRRNASTCCGPRPHTWPSATASTSAWAHSSRAWR